MADTSRSHVTITLGRSGQVVKRPGHSLDSSSFNSQPTAGKRSVKDRLGGIADDSTPLSKRKRGDGTSSSLNTSNGEDDVLLGKDDLRFKIMQKSSRRGSGSNGIYKGVDLREKLSRPLLRESINLSTRRHIPDQKDAGRSRPEVKDSRLHLPLTRDIRQYSSDSEPKGAVWHRPETRGVRQYRDEAKDIRQHRHEAEDSRQYRHKAEDIRQYRPETKDVRRHMPEPNKLGMLGRIPSFDTSPLPHSSRNPYSPWTLDRIRQRSPDRISSSSRGISPQRIEDEIQRRPGIRTYDDVRRTPYIGKDVHELSRPMNSTSFMSKTIPPVAPAKPLTQQLLPLPLPGSVMQKNSYLVEEPLTVDSFLRSLGLEKYGIHFTDEEVDMATLRQMGDHDLKELGIPMVSNMYGHSELKVVSLNKGSEEKNLAYSTISL